LAVVRFHYRGGGHSDGQASQVTHDSMVEDALAASEWLVEKTGIARIGLVGTR
jgi:alpha/beta superfamily hydrolase